MHAHVLGPVLVLLFGLSQALRDVYFAHLFQQIDVFLVILVAFSLAMLGFGAAALRGPGTVRRMRQEWRLMLWMNATTALAWTSYFFALKQLQPSVVNTLHSGIGPLTVIVLGWAGLPFVPRAVVRRLETACHAGLAATLAYLWWVVLSDRSGLAAGAFALWPLALLIVSGASITISLLIARRLNERGIGPAALTATRYVLIIAIAAVAVWRTPHLAAPAAPTDWILLAVAAGVLIVLPLYALQIGVAHTAPLTAHVIRALGPVFVFALELFDGRIAYSAPVLAGIALYSFFTLAGALAHGWSAATGRPPAARVAPKAPSR